MAPKATIGRIVHCTLDSAAAQKLNQLGGRKYATGDKVPGIVVRAGENNVCNLTLFPDAEEVVHMPNMTFSAGNQPGTWNWPERTGETQEAAA